MIMTILETADIVDWLNKYVGLIDDRIEKRLIALANSEFDAGYRALQQAARSETERDSLLREARSRFNKALSLESGQRLAWALLGLALCHLALGDRCNANVVLLDLVFLDPAKLSGFWARTFRRAPDAELLEMQRGAREFLFKEYRYAVPVNDGEYDFRLLRNAT